MKGDYVSSKKRLRLFFSRRKYTLASFLLYQRKKSSCSLNQGVYREDFFLNSLCLQESLEGHRQGLCSGEAGLKLKRLRLLSGFCHPSPF